MALIALAKSTFQRLNRFKSTTGQLRPSVLYELLVYAQSTRGFLLWGVISPREGTGAPALLPSSKNFVAITAAWE